MAAQGSRSTFAPLHPRKGSDSSMSTDPSRAIRTLIVDDDPAVRSLHASFLRALDGFELVGTVGTGSAGAAAGASRDVDLVLLDMRLPDFSGIEVLHRLRELRGSAVDVFVISSARDRTTVRQALSARVVGYLVKPFTEEAFAQRLQEYRQSWAEARQHELEVSLGQGEIDSLVRGVRPPTGTVPVMPHSSLPKGLSDATMQRILDALSPSASRTVAEVAETTGTSRPTARRYLDHLVRVGEVDLSHRYGRRGRPEVLYRLA